MAVSITAFWNPKAKEWVKGRINLFEHLKESISTSDKIIWIHNSSAGEFEQAKPVIESLKQQYPEYKILVSFFSPSGFAVGKRYPHADHICYLPLDTAQNAQTFLSIVNPALVLFIKYDYWYHYLSAVNKKNIPLFLVSAVYRKNQIFFKWYGGFYRKMLRLFQHIFVQDEYSLRLLRKIGISRCSITGDTRFDRVAEIAENFTAIPLIADFINQHADILVAGSTWPDDEKFLRQIANKHQGLKIIIAPHEINSGHLKEIQKTFPEAVLFSQLGGLINRSEKQVLVIDNIGMLSRLYKYAAITYIGGGFTKTGVHNTLEAAVYGKPVVFGANYERYREAVELVKEGGGFSFANLKELEHIIASLLNDKEIYTQSSTASEKYILKQKGATKKLISYIQEKRLLTN